MQFKFLIQGYLIEQFLLLVTLISTKPKRKLNYKNHKMKWKRSFDSRWRRSWTLKSKKKRIKKRKMKRMLGKRYWNKRSKMEKLMILILIRNLKLWRIYSRIFSRPMNQIYKQTLTKWVSSPNKNGKWSKKKFWLKKSKMNRKKSRNNKNSSSRMPSSKKRWKRLVSKEKLCN